MGVEGRTPLGMVSSMVPAEAAASTVSSLNWPVGPSMGVEGWMPPGMVSSMILAGATSSLDGARSPVGAVSFMMLAGAVSSLSWPVGPAMGVEGRMLPGMVSPMVLVEVPSFDGAKSPVGVVSSMMLARAGAVSSRVEQAAISSIIAASTSVASDGPSVIMRSLMMISRVLEAIPMDAVGRRWVSSLASWRFRDLS